MVLSSSALSPDYLHFNKDQKHTENGGEYQEMALFFNFFHKVKAL